MKIFFVFWGLFSLFLSVDTCASTHYKITSNDQSLRPEVEKNLRLYLEDFKRIDNDNIAYWSKQLVKHATHSLQSLGYYNSVISVNLIDELPETIVHVDVAMGYPIVITHSTFLISGEGMSDEKFMSQRNSYPLVVGSKFDHGSYQRIKSAMTNTAANNGYFDAKWKTHHVLIDPSLQTAKISLVFDTGQRYRLGEIIIAQTHASNNIVKAIAPFSHHDFFTSEYIAQYNIALNKSRYFTSVQAIPAPPNKLTKTIDINVTVINRPKNIVEVSAGITSDLGERGRLKWVKPWINRYGHSLESEIKLNQQEQSFTNHYKVPHGNPNEDFTNYVLGWQHTNNDINSHNRYSKYSLQWQRHQVINEDWKRVLLLKLETENDDIDSASRQLIIPGINYTRSRRQGGITPFWGDRQFISLEASNTAWGSTSNFNKLTLRSNWLRTINDKHQFLVKLEAGYIDANTIDDVPVSMRYFAGGDNNLRAYDFKSISPLTNDGVARGALTQLLSTVEYSYPIYHQWRLAIFHDAGSIDDTLLKSQYADAGIGLRLKTPVGLIRLDFAKGLKGHNIKAFDRPFGVSLAIGLDL